MGREIGTQGTNDTIVTCLGFLFLSHMAESRRYGRTEKESRQKSANTRTHTNNISSQRTRKVSKVHTKRWGPSTPTPAKAKWGILTALLILL